MFKTKFDETITQIFTRFIEIVNSLGNQGKIFTHAENVNKFLRALPKWWSRVKTPRNDENSTHLKRWVDSNLDVL